MSSIGIYVLSPRDAEKLNLSSEADELQAAASGLERISNSLYWPVPFICASLKKR